MDPGADSLAVDVLLVFSIAQVISTGQFVKWIVQISTPLAPLHD